MARPPVNESPSRRHAIDRARPVAGLQPSGHSGRSRARATADPGTGGGTAVAHATTACDRAGTATTRVVGSATIARTRPAVVAVAGITAYRQAFGVRKAQTGEQPEPVEGARLWVVPNPSGLNAHETVESLAVAYAEPARAAGLLD